MESFEDLYTCSPAEFRDAMERLTADPQYAQIAPLLYPDLTPDELRRQLYAMSGVREFQEKVMSHACQYIIDHSMTSFTYSGWEYIADGRPALFISNHRDIVLDAMLLQCLQLANGHDSSYLVVGSNLFATPLMAILARVNKMFGIGRGGSPREYYEVLMTMSQYLRYVVVQRHSYAWIAQRNGRTKDGIDRTDPALVKMIAASGDPADPTGSLIGMNIIPVSISYEWEPCGVQKAREVSLTRQGPYVKQPGEDTQSIVRGIADFKGRVHLAICPPVQPSELQALQGDFKGVAQLLDRRIADGFHLWPNHYIAADILAGRSAGSGYTPAERESFERYLDSACADNPIEGFREILLGIYANSLNTNR